MYVLDVLVDRSGLSSDEVIVEMCVDMLRSVPPHVQDAEQEAVSAGQGAPLCYTDMIKLSNGQDLTSIKKKLKVPEPPKKKDGTGSVQHVVYVHGIACIPVELLFDS